MSLTVCELETVVKQIANMVRSCLIWVAYNVGGFGLVWYFPTVRTELLPIILFR
jgi:hypothetical protein